MMLQLVMIAATTVLQRIAFLLKPLLQNLLQPCYNLLQGGATKVLQNRLRAAVVAPPNATNYVK